MVKTHSTIRQKETDGITQSRDVYEAVDLADWVWFSYATDGWADFDFETAPLLSELNTVFKPRVDSVFMKVQL